MPNWIVNNLDIKGDADILEFFLQYFTINPAENGTFSVKVAGQENPCYGFDLNTTRIDDNHVTVRFDTKWIPAYYWVVERAKEYPDLSIDFGYDGECVGGDAWFRSGKIEIEEHGCDLFRMKDHLADRMFGLHIMAESSRESADRAAEKLQPYIQNLGLETALKFFDEQARIRSEIIAAYNRSREDYYTAGGPPLSLLDKLKMRTAMRPGPVTINPNTDLHPPSEPVFSDPDFGGILWWEEHCRRRAARMTERAEAIKAWDFASRHLTRFRYHGSEMEMTDWLHATCPKALTYHDEVMEDRDEDRLYIALNENEAATFEGHWKDQISVCR